MALIMVAETSSCGIEQKRPADLNDMTFLAAVEYLPANLISTYCAHRFVHPKYKIAGMTGSLCSGRTYLFIFPRSTLSIYLPSLQLCFYRVFEQALL